MEDFKELRAISLQPGLDRWLHPIYQGRVAIIYFNLMKAAVANKLDELAVEAAKITLDFMLATYFANPKPDSKQDFANSGHLLMILEPWAVLHGEYASFKQMWNETKAILEQSKATPQEAGIHEIRQPESDRQTSSTEVLDLEKLIGTLKQGISRLEAQIKHVKPTHTPGKLKDMEQ